MKKLERMMRKSRMRKDQVVMIECAFICVSELAVVVGDEDSCSTLVILHRVDQQLLALIILSPTSISILTIN